MEPKAHVDNRDHRVKLDIMGPKVIKEIQEKEVYKEL